MIDMRWYRKVGCVLSAYCLVLSATAVSAEVPHLIRYQGQAVDTNGVPLEGPYTLTFRLYDAETVGNKVWEEIQPNVPLSKGHFSVLLGSVNVLSAMDWSRPCWLGVQVNSEPELSPRQRITSVPLAITAEKLAVPVTTSTITDDDNSLVPTGAIILWNSATCPAGYTRLSAYDGKFLVGSNTAGTTGGSNTHTHSAGTYVGPSHTHQMDSGSVYAEKHVNPAGMGDAVFIHANGFLGATGGGEGGGTVVSAVKNQTTTGGTGSITGTSASTDSRPEFLTILLCQKN